MTERNNDADSAARSPRTPYGEPFTGVACTVFDADVITPGVREFGKLPDMAEWQPADVVLLRPRGKVTAITNLIRIVQQRRKFGAEHVTWTHVGLYIGQGRILHVNRNDAKLGNFAGEAHISDYVLEADFRVRSPRSLTHAVRHSIVERARELLAEETEYSTARAVALGLEAVSLFSDKYLASAEVFGGIVCSDVVAIAYHETLNRQLPVFATARHQTPLPATFSASSFLTDLHIAWCAIPAASAV